MINKFYIGDIVKMRKVHPCGSDEWEVIRVGADIKIKCLGCSKGSKKDYKIKCSKGRN